MLNVIDFNPGPVSKISVHNPDLGRRLPSSVDFNSKPIDYFPLFFNEDSLQKICDETILYAQKLQKPIPLQSK